MARFGQGVMPQLGATDYTPFMQGSIRGSESVARGIEALGAGVAQGIQQYQKNKDERDTLTTLIEGKSQRAISIVPELQRFKGDPSSLQDTVSKVQDMPKMSLAKLRAINAELDVTLAGAERQIEPVRQAAMQRAIYAQSAGRLANVPGVDKRVAAYVSEFGPVGAAQLASATEALTPKPVKPENLSIGEAYAQNLEADAVARGETVTPKMRAGFLAEGARLASPKNIRTPDEEARAAYLAARAKDAAAFRSAIGVAARQGIESNDLIQRNIELLSSGDVKTGVGAEWIKNAKSAVNTILGESAFDLGKQEEAARNFADFALAAAARMQKQGQITEGERKLLRDTVAQYGSSREGNLRILRVMLAVNNRTAALNQHLNDIESAGGMPTEAEAVKFYQENPLDAFFVVEEGGAQSPETAPSQGSVKASADDTAAMAWLQSNPNHPLAASVRARLTSRGLMP